MTPPRSFHVFAVVFAAVFAIAYVISVEKNFALFTYHPAIGEFGLWVEKPKSGPAMYWYGWMATAGVVAFLAGAIAALLPEFVKRLVWSGWSWVIPVCAMVASCYLLREFFLR
jgi:hypothetical protein